MFKKLFGKLFTPATTKKNMKRVDRPWLKMWERRLRNKA